MENIWAPWRGEYVSKADKNDGEGCVFCRKLNEGRARERDNLILIRGETAFAAMNLFPYNNGHLMVLPVRHTGDFLSLSNRELDEMLRFKRVLLEILKKLFAPNGFNLGMNLGSAGGAGIAEHLHEHIVPRWRGDTNFMPILGETRVISEHILVTYDKILGELKNFNLTLVG